MEEGNRTGLIISIIIGIAILAACGVLAALLIFLAWITVL